MKPTSTRVRSMPEPDDDYTAVVCDPRPRSRTLLEGIEEKTESKVVSEHSLMSPPRAMSGYFERKYYDNYHALASIGSGYFACVNAVGAGTGVDGRVGREIVPAGIEFTFMLTPISDTAEYARVCVISDAAPNGTSATTLDIFDTSYVPSIWFAFLNYGSFGNRFKLLYDFHSDELCIRNTTAGPYLGEKPNTHHVKIKMPKQKVRFPSSNSGTPSTHGVYVLCYGLSTSTSAYFAYSLRYSFNDA